MQVELIVVGFLATLAVVFLAKSLVIVQQSQAVVVERLGSYHRTMDPGINILIPFIDKPRPIKVRRYRHGDKAPVVVEENRIDRRETVVDLPRQPMITKDNVTVAINVAVYYQIIDPQRAVYEIEDFANAVEVLAKTSLRSEVGRMDLDDIFESREQINDRLAVTLDEATSKWGVKVTRVELQDIAIPGEIEEAMRAQMTAERNRRAMVTEANGKREAEIKQAEGERQAAILLAQGDKESAILRAEGERKSIETIMESDDASDMSRKEVVQYLIALEYMKTLPNIAKDGERVFLPVEATQLLSSVGGIGDLLKPVAGGVVASK